MIPFFFLLPIITTLSILLFLCVSSFLFCCFRLFFIFFILFHPTHHIKRIKHTLFTALLVIPSTAKMLLRGFASRPARAMAFWAVVLLSGIYFFSSLPLPAKHSAVSLKQSPEPVPMNATETIRLREKYVAELKANGLMPGPDGLPMPIPEDILDSEDMLDSANADTPEKVDKVDDGDEDEDDVVVPPLHTTENLLAYTEPERSNDETDADAAEIDINNNNDIPGGANDESADVLDSTRAAFEQLIDDMDRDHAILENEVENLVQAQDDKTIDEIMANIKTPNYSGEQADAEALSNAQVNQAKAHWQNFNHMYKNIKDVAKEIHGHLTKAGSDGKDAAAKHTAEFLAAVKAAEDDEIHKINLVHTTKRSIGVDNADAKADADNNKNNDNDNDSDESTDKFLERWRLSHPTEAKTGDYWGQPSMRYSYLEVPLREEVRKQIESETYEPDERRFEPSYFKVWLKIHYPERYKERFGDDDETDNDESIDVKVNGNDNGNGKLAKRWLFEDDTEPEELTADEQRFHDYLKKEKPAFYKIHFAKEIRLAEKKTKAEEEAKEKAEAEAEAEHLREEERRQGEILFRKVETGRLPASKDYFPKWLREHHPKVFLEAYPYGVVSEEYVMAYRYHNQDHSIPEQIRKALYDAQSRQVSSNIYHDWLKADFPEWRRQHFPNLD